MNKPLSFYAALMTFVACASGTIVSCSTSADAPGAAGSGSGGIPSAGGSPTASSGGPGAAGITTSSGGSPVTTAGGSAGGAKAAAGAGGAANGGGGQAAGSSSGGAIGGGGAAGGSGGGSGTGRSKGCGQTSTITFGQVPGESGQNVGTGAGGYAKIGSRGFAMRLPDGYDKNKAYPLFFGFHWQGGSAKDVDTGGSNGYIMAHYGLQKLSKNGAFFVAPDGLGGGWANNNKEDSKFVDDMVQQIEDNYCIDTTHLFANGFSYGGGMTYELACSRAKVFRAAAIYEGAQLSGCDGGTDPIALWQMVGLTDTRCPMNLAVPIRDRFVANNSCTVQNPPQPAQPPPYSATMGHICTDYAGCSTGHPLRWCVHQSGHGNAIVDGTDSVYNECANPDRGCSTQCPCTWVPDDVWKFFSAL